MDALASVDGLSDRDWDTGEPEGTVRFAMIGCGWWTRDAAIPAVRESDYCETTVVVSSSTEKAEDTADLDESIEHALTYDEFHDGAAADAYDAVYICTPNALHLPYVETAVDLGKAILCEKPMESTPERAAELVEVADEGDEPLMIGYRMHTEPAVRRLRELIEDGALGNPVLVEGNMSQPLLDVIPDTDQWRLDPELSGGTTLMDIGLYPLNTTRYVLGEDPVSGRATVKYDDEAFADTGDEHVAFSLDFPGNVTASCVASYGAYKASHLRVVGTEGEAIIEPAFYPDEGRVLRVSRGGATAEVDFDQVNQMLEEFDYFGHCVLTGTDPHADGRHGLTDVRIMDGLYEAAENDTVVEFDF